MSKIKLNAPTGGGSVSLEAPSSTASNANVEFKLPNADGSSGQVLKTDGSGNLSFGADSGGKILKMESTTKADGFTSTSTSYVDVTGLTVSIQPTAASSKIYIVFSIHAGGQNGAYTAYRLVRGSTAIAIHAGSTGNQTSCTVAHQFDSGSITTALSSNFRDTPSYNLGDTLTYKIQGISHYNNYEFCVNRPSSAPNSDYVAKGSSTITAIEVAA